MDYLGFFPYFLHLAYVGLNSSFNRVIVTFVVNLLVLSPAHPSLDLVLFLKNSKVFLQKNLRKIQEKPFQSHK